MTRRERSFVEWWEKEGSGMPPQPDEDASEHVERVSRIAWLRGWDEAIKPRTSWFTFGQSHVHSVNGFTYDKDVVVQITAYDPRAVMFATFDRKWAMEYGEPPDMKHFPRGIKVLQ